MSFTLDVATGQEVLKKARKYSGEVDGLYGPKTLDAVKSVYWNRVWDKNRNLVAAIQTVLSRSSKKITVGSIDGLYGPMTQAAVEVYLDIKPDRKFPRPKTVGKSPWPTYGQMTKFYGKPGTNQVLLELPYPMQLAWDVGVTVNRISIHKKCHDSAKTIFNNILSEYGYGQIKELKLNLFGGALNVRKMRGGSKWSTHAWGAAIDIDPEGNGLRVPYKKARFSHSRYDPYWKFIEDEGWVSLGRARNMDTMHWQACRA